MKLIVNNLLKTYDNGRKVINDINLELESSNKIYGLLGPNGAGKTTLIKIICGLVKPSHGEIIFYDDARLMNFKNIKSKISVVLEGTRNLYWRLTIKENIKYFLTLKGKDYKKNISNINYYLDLFNLKNYFNTEVRKLSRGMMQKVAITIALCSEPEIVILDEPTLGLDIQSVYELRKILQKLKKKYNGIFILSSHDMNFIENCVDNVILIKNGQVVYNDVLKNIKNFMDESYYVFKINQNKKIENSKFKHKEIKSSGVKYHINSGNLVDFLHFLNENNLVENVLDIKKIDNNLESVFLKIVNSEEL